MDSPEEASRPFDPPATPTPSPAALQVREARLSLVASADRRVQGAHESLIEAPKASLDAIRDAAEALKEVAGTVKERAAADRAASAERIKEEYDFRKLLREAVAEVRDAAPAAPPRGKFEIAMEFAQAVVCSAVQGAGPEIVELIGLAAAPLLQGAPKEVKETVERVRDRVVKAAQTPVGADPQAATAPNPAPAQGDPPTPVRVMYDELPAHARASMSFEEFTEAFERTAAKVK